MCIANLGLADDAYMLEGYSQPNRIAKVAAATSGIVDELVAKEGQFIKEGTCIAKLDSKVHEQVMAVARAARDSQGELEAAKAEMEANEKRINIIRDLARRQHASPEEVMRAESEYQISTAHLRTAMEKQQMRKAEYAKLLSESANYCVRAPFSGVIIEFHKQRGEFVGAVDPGVCTIAELSKLSVDFFVPRVYRSQLKVNAEVVVRFVELNKEVRGRIYYISPFPDGETKTYVAKVRIDNANLALNAGEACQLELDSITYGDEVPRGQLTRTRN